MGIQAMTMRDVMLWFMSPATKAKAQAETRLWVATCSNCHATTSLWELGGLRYKGSGRPVMRIKCPHCGQWAAQSLVYTGDKQQGPRFLSDKAKRDAEAESKLWTAECPNCHKVQNAWELGGLEYKAAGGVKIFRTTCPNCGKNETFRLTKADKAPEPEPPPAATA
jgi:predicted RNA-binding Zn-ribbon protein involved in translation (DUF1610 family)